MDLAQSISIISKRLMVAESGTYFATATTDPQYLQYTTAEGTIVKKYIINTNLTTTNRLNEYIKKIEEAQDEGAPIGSERLSKITNKCSLNYSIYNTDEHMPTKGEVFVCHITNVGTEKLPEYRITKIEENKPTEPDTVENMVDIGESIQSNPQQAAQ